MKSEDRRRCLYNLLSACTSHIVSGCIKDADKDLDCISTLASIDGDSMQRMAAYFNEALGYKVVKHLPGAFSALNSTKVPSVSDELVAQKCFHKLCPFLKLAYEITNRAIIEAMEGEKVVHIIDFNCFEPTQWLDLLRSFRQRPEGAPHIRITGVHQQKVVLDHMSALLTEVAEDLAIPFQFNAVVGTLEDMDVDRLGVRLGEALAVSCVLQLHTLLENDNGTSHKNSAAGAVDLPESMHLNRRSLAEWLAKDFMNTYNPIPNPSSSPVSPSPSPRMENFLSSLRALSPKLMVITEQESDLNVSHLMERVTAALHYYDTLFDCLESTVSRTSIERQKVEKVLFGEEIKNIITCEGLDRKKRYEKLEKWIYRLESAGFSKFPMNYHGIWMQAKRLLESYSNGYTIKDMHGCSVICWQGRPLFSVSAWGTSN